MSTSKIRINKYARLFRSHIVTVLIFIIIFTATISATAFNSMNAYTKYQVSNTLYSSAASLAILYEEYGERQEHVDHMKVLMEGYKESLNIDSILFFDEEIITSTVNVDAQELIKSHEIIYKELLEEGISIREDVDMNGNGYYMCAIALHDEEGNYSGAIIVGKMINLVYSTMKGKQMIYVFFMWIVCLIHIALIIICSVKKYAKFVDWGNRDRNRK